MTGPRFSIWLARKLEVSVDECYCDLCQRERDDFGPWPLLAGPALSVKLASWLGVRP